MASRQSGSGGGATSDTVVGSYRIGSEIGRGSFAAVFKGHHTINKTLAAIKMVQRSKLSRKLLENLESEIHILKKLNHPHIVALTDCKKTDKFIHLIMEFCSVSDLSVLIKKRDRLHTIHPCLDAIARDYPSPPGGGIHEVLVRHFLKQLASALEFLRKDGLVHRDVKPQNLLLNPPPDYEAQFGDEGNMEGSRMLVGLSTLPVLKLADFGFARVLPSTAMAETLCGSPLYMAPEILRYEKYDATADLWSVGTVLYEMMAGKPPFRAPNHVDLLRKIESRNDRIDFPSSCNSSEELRGLVRSLLKRNPVERMSFEEFFKHPVITADIPGVRVPRVEPVAEARRVELPLRAESGEMRSSPPARRPLVEARRSSVDTERNSPRGLSSSPRRKAHIENSALPFATTTDDNQAGVPSRPADVRRYTTQTGARVREQQTSTRPGMPAHSTAPAREDLIPQRRNAVPMERVQSRESNPSPGASLMMQQREQEREQRGSKERHPSARRGTNSRELRDDDYVIVDKQQVQVNALADEIAISRRRDVTPPSSANALVRRLSSAGAQRTSPRQVARATEHVHTIGSYERNYGSSPGTSAKSALAKALDIANLRLFGGSLSPPNHSPPNMAAQFPPYASPGSLVVAGNNGNMLEEDLRTIHSIEESASRSDVVYSFAEVKYAQVMPSASLTPQSHGLGLVSTGSTQAFDAPSEGLSSELTPDATILAAEECLVLFVKVLSILSKATDVAHAWWAASGEPMLPARIAASSRMNNVVQWIRERFNEVLEKAEAVQGKIMDAQKDLPPNHPSRPSNAQSDISLGSAGNNFMLTTGVTAEKLMYDRALEMSRASAVNELVGDDLPGCEIAYVTSLRLLEAVLERRDDDDHYLHDDDRKAIEKFLVHIRQRLTALRKKMEFLSRRSPVHSAHGSPRLYQQPSPPIPASSPGPALR